MERAGWKCEICGKDSVTLNVHHVSYHGEPWDAPDNALQCLCEDCHTDHHNGDKVLYIRATDRHLIALLIVLDLYQRDVILPTIEKWRQSGRRVDEVTSAEKLATAGIIHLKAQITTALVKCGAMTEEAESKHGLSWFNSLAASYNDRAVE